MDQKANSLVNDQHDAPIGSYVPQLAVIICAYTEQRWNDLVAAVASVEQQTRRPDEVIIVIDHNPALLERARQTFASHKVVENRAPRGLSGARNSGIAATKAEFLAFLDDDATAAPDWLERLVEPLENPNVLGVGGQILPAWESHKPGWFPDEFLWVVGCTHRGVPTRRAAVRNLVGASMLIRRRVFDAVGGFLTDIGRVGTLPLGCEETELCIRARQQLPGTQFIYEPAAKVYHKVPKTRAAWRYFQARCFAEGISKAAISRMVGSQDALAAERAHVAKALPLGVLRGVRDTLIRREIAGLGRAAAIIAGLAVTGIGYVRGRMAKRPSTALPDASALPTRPLRILMVSARYFPLVGGTETHTAEAARRMAALGHDVSVLTTDVTGNLAPHELHNGVNVRRVRAWPHDRDYYFAPGIFTAIVSGQWDVIHVQGYHTLVAPLAMFAALVARTPYVVTFHSGGHSSALRNAGRGLQRRLLKPLLQRAAHLIGVSRFEADFFAEQLGISRDRFAVIPNGASLPALSRPIAPDADALIVSSGRLEAYKGHQHIIAALPKVLEHRADARLRIAGTGPYETHLRRLADELGVQDRVEIQPVSAANRLGMAELLARASLVVLFSEYEAHPVAVMEALSLKRPVLVADTSGLHELAEQGLVSAIPLSARPEALAAAIIDQLDNPRPPIDVTLPTWEACVAQLLDVYHSVLKRPPSVG